MNLLEWAVLLPWLVVASGCGLGYLLVRQTSRVVERLERLEMDFDTLQDDVDELIPETAEGLPVGSEAPPFELPDLAGRRVALADLRGRRALLIFFSPECSFCRQLAPELAGLPPEGEGGRPAPVIVTTGDPEANRALVAEHGIRCRVLLDEGRQVASLYRADGTPTGFLVDEQGLIASDRADGGAEVLLLARASASADHAAGGGHRHARADAPAPAAGGAAGRHDPHDGRASGDARAPARHALRIPLRGIPREGIGVGDLVRRATDALGIKPCRGCERRRETLNRWVIKGSGGGSREHRKP